MQGSATHRGQYCLFETAIGALGLAWTERGVTRLHLPDSDRGATERRLGSSPNGGLARSAPESIAQVIADVQRYLAGAAIDFSAVPLDLSDVTEFRRNVYASARRIGWGQTVSYGELAQRAGRAGAARAVGQALSRNPVAIIIPCHRILASGNKVGGFTAFGGTSAKELLLGLEGVQLPRP